MPYSTHANLFLTTEDRFPRASRSIKAGEQVEEFPAIIVPKRGRYAPFKHYDVAEDMARLLYFWDRETDTVAMGMGLGGMYAYSQDFNVKVVPDHDRRLFVAIATRDIRIGDPIFREQQFLDSREEEDSVLARVNPATDRTWPVEIRQSQWGLGGFATKDIAEGDFIEVCPALPAAGTRARVSSSLGLNNYTFQWPALFPQREAEGKGMWPLAICLGYGAIYNHSKPEANSHFKLDADNDTITFQASRDIKAGEEILHNYGWSDGDKRFS